MVSFQDIIHRLQSIGLYDVILPFFLIFVIVFAILRKSAILGETDKAKAYDVVVAMIVGLLVVIPHVVGLYPPNADVVVIMNTALPNIALVLVALLALFLIVGLFGGSAAWAGKLTGWVAFVSFLLVVYIFGRAANWFQTVPNWLWWLDNPDTQAMIIVIAVFALVIYFITKEPKEVPEEEKFFTKFGEDVGQLFGRKEK